MFKAERWRTEKKKIKAVFKLQFHATQVIQLGWERAMVSLVPLDVGKPTVRSEKAPVIYGTCYWRKPIYETVKLIQDPKTEKINEKLYNFRVSATGSAKAAVIGETTINLSDYAEVLKPSSISLPLEASNSGPILHVTIQRVQVDVERREADGNGEIYVRKQRRKTTGQLNNNDKEERSKVMAANANTMDDGSFTKCQPQMGFPSTIKMPLQIESDGNLRKSGSSNTISALSNDSSSGQYTPKENGIKNNNTHKDYVSFRSPLSNNGTPQKETTKTVELVTDYRDHWRSITDLSVGSGPDGSLNGSRNSLAESGLGERLQDSDVPLVSDVALARHIKVLQLELQTLRKQVVKQTRRGRDLSRELSEIKEERDALRRECEEFKGSQERFGIGTVSNKSHFDGEDPQPILEEIKQELNLEKNLNANLHLQLQKTQESNSELILAVRDLDELLDQKNRETQCMNCSTVPIRPANSDDLSEIKFGNGYSHLHTYDSKQELFETISKHNEQYALELLVKRYDDVKVAYSLEPQIIDLNSEIELYRKDREDLEMHMEQLALDYEILKQENHKISSKLEQSQLQEQLRMQYECCAQTIITDLEAHVKILKNEIEEQAEAFEADLETIMCAKVQQEQRAIRAEEALRKTRWNNANTAEQLQELQEELERLSAQMSSTFHMNEKLAMQALNEASELRLQKCHLEELLEKTNEELALVQGECHVKVQELSNLIEFKTKETDRLLLELKDKSEVLQNQKKCEEAREKAFSEEIMIFKAEVERLSRENTRISEQIEKNTKLVADMEQLKASTKETEMLLRDRSLERDILDRELASIRVEAEKSVKELHDLRHLKDEKETVIRTLNSEVTTLKAQYNDLKHSLFEDELEIENLRKQVFQLRGDLQKKEDAITSTEKKLEDGNARLTSSNGTTKTTIRNKNNIYGPAPQGSKEVASLREKISLLEGKIKSKDTTLEDTKNSFLMKEKDLNHRTEELQKNINQNRGGFCEGIAQKEQEDKIVGEKLNRVKANGKILLQCIMGVKAGLYDLNGINREVTTGIVGTGLENKEEDSISNNLNQGSLAEILSEMTVL